MRRVKRRAPVGHVEKVQWVVRDAVDHLESLAPYGIEPMQMVEGILDSWLVYIRRYLRQAGAEPTPDEPDETMGQIVPFPTKYFVDDLGPDKSAS